MDRKWWQKYHEKARQHFKGELVCVAERCFGVRRVRFKHGGNSGAGAMALAAYWGAKRIILLGYDCKYAEDGKRHWHGDHPRGLGNAVSMPKWKPQFKEMAQQLDGLKIVNSTRDTALKFWPRQSLEKALDV